VDELSKKIYNLVREYNERKEDIFLKKLVDSFGGEKAKSKICGRLNWLEKNRYVRREPIGAGQGTQKNLYVINPDNKDVHQMKDEVNERLNALLVSFKTLCILIEETCKRPKR